MATKYFAGEGIETVTTDQGLKFDYYYSTVKEDAFDGYSHFVYLVVKRVDSPDSKGIKRHVYLVPSVLLDEFLATVKLPGEKIVHIEPVTVEMIGFIRDELRKDHIIADR